MKGKREVAGVVAGVILFTAQAYAATGSSGTGGTSDEAIVLGSLHDANQNERDVATLAKTRSKSQTVKDFAETLLDDNKDADARIRAYARNRQIDLDALARQNDSAMEDEIARDRWSRSIGSATGEYAFTSENDLRRKREEATPVGKLKRLDGKEFDRAFVKNVAADHESLLDLLANARTHASGDLKTLIESLLPNIQQHLTAARRLVTTL